MPGQPSFEGTLLKVPFGSETLQEVVIEEYRSLLEDHDSEDVLVLTGAPTSMETFREELADECPGATVPYVTSVIVHATEIINRTDDRAILSDQLRRELVHRFLTDIEWDHEYFQRASQQESFTSDVAQLLETATWQNVDFDTTPELQEIAAIRDEFHGWLADHDHLERGQMISEATRKLAQSDRDDVLDFDAILVIEFEEFVDADRRYLQMLAEDRDLICIAESDASIKRTLAETGSISDHVSFSEQQSVESTEPETRPAAIASYLARDEAVGEPDTGDVTILTAETADEELERIADEIEQLRDQHDVAYDDIAVALKHSGDAVIETIQALEEAGIPTDSTSVIGFGDDPAIRELLQVVYKLAGDNAPKIEGVEGSESPTFTDNLQTELAEADNLADAIRKWATESGLKHRIATMTPPLTARTHFSNVRRAFNIADFIEKTEFIDATWSSLAEILTRAHEYAPQQNQTGAIERIGGVRVDNIRAIKNGSFQTVFLPQVVDAQYPGRLHLSNLFPQERVMRMPDYPGISQADAADVRATYSTDSTASSRPVRQYHAEHARRLLAIGAASATDRLYLSLHTHEDTPLDERVQPSRFLADVYHECPWVASVGESLINNELAAEDFLLSRIDTALADVRRAQSQEVTISLDEIETEFAEIQSLLANSGERGDQLREAVQARLDFADGRVKHE